MRRGITKAVSAMVAAALMCSMVPASALAADEVASGSSTLGVKLKYLQLSVDAPTQVVFEPTEGEGYDVRDPDTWGDLVAQVPFTNRSDSAVYLAAANVLQTTEVNVGNLFNGPTPTNSAVGTKANPFLTLRSSESRPGAVCESVSPSTASTAMDFTNTFISTFIIGEKDATGKGTDASFALTLDKTAAQLKPLTAIKGDMNATITDFCSMTWTFSMLPDFYLQVAHKPVSSVNSPTYSDSDRNLYGSDYSERSTRLLYNAGKVFSLSDVKAASKSIAANATSSNETYQLYYYLATSLAPEGDYDCRVKYTKDGKAEWWPLRIIGLNQDIAANSEDGYTATSSVGLTFQFRDLVDRRVPNSADSNSGGWGGVGEKAMRDALQSGGDIFENLSIKDSIVSVKKAYGPDSGRVSTIRITGENGLPGDKMFIASFRELCTKEFSVAGTPGEMPWMRLEGTGPSHDEQYLFYRNKDVSCASDKNDYLAKSTQRDADGSRIVSLTGGGDAFRGGVWWLRTVSPESTAAVVVIAQIGALHGGLAVNLDPDGQGVCPCFCL